ncbi:FAR1 DNA-binding domain [Sesbania bispinosa]|nr:FAR1 DNA-binding domain [Sesbania bispinosa]
MDDHVSIQGSLQFGTFQSNEVHTGLDVTCSESSSFSDMGNSENGRDNEEIETPIIVTKEQDQYEPKIGMILSNEDEAYKFYNEYAKFIGFTVRRNQYRRLADGTLRQRTFVCGREGHRKPKDPSHVSKINRKETRTGCPAMICFTIEKDTWIVSKFISDHNHDLENSSVRAMLRSQRHVDEAHANIIEVMDNAGIKPCGMYSYFVEAAGGVQNVGCLYNCESEKEFEETMSLTQFILRYEKVLERRRWSELQKDFECNQSAPPRVKKLTASSTGAKDLSTTSTPASTFYFSHISQVASASSSQVANKNHISNNILLSFPYTQLSSGSTMGQEKP